MYMQLRALKYGLVDESGHQVGVER